MGMDWADFEQLGPILRLLWQWCRLGSLRSLDSLSHTRRWHLWHLSWGKICTPLV